MASQGYRDWLNAGRPYTLIRPAAALVAALRGHGLTVYHYPNAAHLEATTPEEHTPFSVTGWPGTNKRWNARGVDIMPRSSSAAHRKENADIARQLIRDRDGGHPGAMWIKYINWTDENGTCRQERWMDASAPLRRTTRLSSDKGHIHISGRSDVDNDDRADGYDPIARKQGDDDMQLKDPTGWDRQFMPNPEGVKEGPWLGGTLGNQLQYIREATAFSLVLDQLTSARVVALTTVIERLAGALAGAGGSIDTAAILAGVDERLAELAEKLAAEQRDAVADLGEGGAAQVRGPRALGS